MGPSSRVLRSKKKMMKNKKSAKKTFLNPLKTFSRDFLLVELVARVAKTSAVDLVKLRLTCRDMNLEGKHSYTYKHVSLNGLPLALWKPKSSPEFQSYNSFVQICVENGNSEALYRLGMVAFFANSYADLGRSLLVRAANHGHKIAPYVLGIILISSVDVDSILKGVEMLKKIQRDNEVSKCRMKAKMILSQMWRKDVLTSQEPICGNKFCTKDEGKKWPRWVSEYEEENLVFDCEDCKLEFELKLFKRMLSGH